MRSARLDGVLPLPASKEDSRWAPADEAAAHASPDTSDNVIPLPVSREVPAGPPPEFLTTVSFTPPAEERCWSCVEALPTGPCREVLSILAAPISASHGCVCVVRRTSGTVERRWKRIARNAA